MDNGTVIRLYVADRHPICVEGMRATMARVPGIDLAGTTSDWETALGALSELTPDVAIIDDALAGCEQTLAAVVERSPGTRVIFLADSVDAADPYTAMGRGAAGYLTRDAAPEAVTAAVRDVHAGRTTMTPALQTRFVNEIRDRLTGRQSALTPRQREILRLITQGRSTSEVADALLVSLGTVKADLGEIYARLGVTSRAEAVAVAIRRGLVE